MTYSEFTNLVLQEISQLLSLNQFNVTLSPYPNQAGGKLNSIHSVIPPPHSQLCEGEGPWALSGVKASRRLL